MKIPVIDLLEEFEYYPEEDSKDSRILVVLGGILVVLGILGTVFFLVARPIVALPSSPGWLNLAGALVAITMLGLGIFLALRSMSRGSFRKINHFLETRIWGIYDTLLVSSTLLMMAISFTSLIFMSNIVNENAKQSEILISLAPVFAASLMMGLLHLAIRAREIRLGIVGIRPRLRGGVLSRWADSIVCLSFLSLPVAAVSVVEDGVAWIAVAMTVIFTVVGWHFAGARAFDRNTRNLVGHFERVRELCLVRKGPVVVVDRQAIYKEIRAMQMNLAGYPRVVPRPFIFGGLLALCIVIDARARGGSERWVAFAGEKRQEAAKEVLCLNDWEFADQLGRVFDALLQQMDRGFAPGMQKVKGDLRSVYEASLEGAKVQTDSHSPGDGSLSP